MDLTIHSKILIVIFTIFKKKIDIMIDLFRICVIALTTRHDVSGKSTRQP